MITVALAMWERTLCGRNGFVRCVCADVSTHSDRYVLAAALTGGFALLRAGEFMAKHAHAPAKPLLRHLERSRAVRCSWAAGGAGASNYIADHVHARRAAARERARGIRALLTVCLGFVRRCASVSRGTVG